MRVPCSGERPTAIRALILIFLAACLLNSSAPASGEPPAKVSSLALDRSDSTLPGEIEIIPTIHCIGFKWFIEGDSNLNCQVALEYKRSYTADTWHQAHPLLRVEPDIFEGYDVDPGNLLAGSVMSLIPETVYDLRLTLSDPDNGAPVETTLTVQTRAIPTFSPTARTRYVIPGDGGGCGTQQDPFRGIATADAAAEPGDLFLLGEGIYTGRARFTANGTETDPIIWRGVDAASVIFDGELDENSVVEFSRSEYVHLERVTIIRPKKKAVWGLNTTGIVVESCIIDMREAVGYDLIGIHVADEEQRNAYICGNVIAGPLTWTEGRDDDHYGIVVTGTGHVICRNEIFDVYDAIQVGSDRYWMATSDCDVYGNELYNCTDDGIELDSSRNNTRIFDNRITNCLCGISCQPVFGGPATIIRNVVYNWQLKPLKFHHWPTGILVYHNTFVGAAPEAWNGGQWRNAIVKNNIFVAGSSTGHSGDPICLDTNAERIDLDNNGWYQADPSRFGDLNGELYGNIEDFSTYTGHEQKGVLLDLNSFVDVEEPPLGSWLGEDGYPPPYAPGSEDLRLLALSPAVDVGVLLPNINDGYTGSAPDLGAYEIGSMIPPYGVSGVLEPVFAMRPDAGLSSFPNPFRPSATISIQTPEVIEEASILIFDVQGRRVRSLSVGTVQPGIETIVWDGRNDFGVRVPSGLYLLRLTHAGGVSRTLKAIRAE